MIDLNTFSTWNEAATWLARHGYGLGSIELIKQEWDAAQTPAILEPVATPTPEPVITPVIEPEQPPVVTLETPEPVATTEESVPTEQSTEVTTTQE